MNPESVLEVGSGYGIKLFVLSGYFSTIRFRFGTDQAGGLSSKKIGKLSSLSQDIVNFAPDQIIDQSANRPINFYQGSAKNLPFAEKSFDMNLYRAGLRSYGGIRHQALRELARVAKKIRDHDRAV